MFALKNMQHAALIVIFLTTELCKMVVRRAHKESARNRPKVTSIIEELCPPIMHVRLICRRALRLATTMLVRAIRENTNAEDSCQRARLCGAALRTDTNA